MAMVWEVVGGVEHGGIIVRSGSELTSEILESRLSTGSVIKELTTHDGRIEYELVQGSGPAKGWVTPTLRGKELLIRKDVPVEVQVAAAEAMHSCYKSQNCTHGRVAQQVPKRSGRSAFSQWMSSQDEAETSADKQQIEELECHDKTQPVEPVEVGKGLTSDEAEALKVYLERFGDCRDGSNPGYNRKAFPWYTAPSKQPERETLTSEALHSAMSKPTRRVVKEKHWEVDSEGEEVPLCTRCSLPVGEFSYQGREGKDTCVHAECMAQVLIQDRQREETSRTKRENLKKQKNRKEYDIGWRMDSVPKNSTLAKQMGCSDAPKGLCCLVLDETSRTVKVAATLEPSAAINLEYLLLALKVRRTAQREPLFSLDPVDPQNLEKTPQKKVYEPSWLAGTSVGDVMFQADYFLKELALGEYDMPVLGMLSVFDWSEMKERNKAWAGREWFVVRKAEVRTAEDNTLIPHVRMGVEAREQVVTKKGMEDAPVTLPNHPLKKFADAFTKNFDVIAERKSVVFHLRELAKASVMAKYLVDSKARLDPTWYKLADEIVQNTPPEQYPEIPQLWNMRGNSRIQLKNGKLVDIITGGQSSLQAIYGGVEFGLDRFELAQRHAMTSQAKGPGMPLAQSSRPLFMPQRFQLGQRGEMPQGVDLNLDKFNLSTEERFAGRLPPCSGDATSLPHRTSLGKAFLQSLEQKSWQGVKAADQKLLLNVFAVPQCDRVEEGDAFIPPDPNMEYVTRVRHIVGEEESMRTRRKMRFADKSFSVSNPGPEFPRSWTSGFQLELDGHVPVTAPTKFGLSKIEINDDMRKHLSEEVLPSAASDFEKTAEDGGIFRIYKIGSLEVRTIQDTDGPETICVVFSSGAASWEANNTKPDDRTEKEKLSKCKMYVEAVEHEASNGRVGCNFYLVLETNGKTKTTLVTELPRGGEVTWLQNPRSLEDRNSLAKLLFQADCKEGISVEEVKKFQRSLVLPPGSGSYHCKQYAKAIFKYVTARGLRGKWGGNRKRHAPSSTPSSNGIPGRLGLAAMGHSSDFLNVMWLARSAQSKTGGMAGRGNL
eukprot:symbB.v1.2.008246.t2/scaffold515.1/size193321/8